MRGARLLEGLRIILHRIIPADAGSTFRPVSTSSLAKDHPRGCGEHDRDRIPRATGEGSSPRMRGAPVDRLLNARVRGIIPADAGSTLLGVCHTDEDEDHPRGCGEH